MAARVGQCPTYKVICEANMVVDSYKFLPRSFRPGYESLPFQADGAVWSAVGRPLPEAQIALLTSAGLFLPATQPPFDVEREKREPTWGDPTFRVIPRDTEPAEVDATHLHLNTRDLKEDFNVALPLRAFAELEAAGEIGSLADEHYSLMGYQVDGLDEWRTTYGPDIASRLKKAAVDAVVLAPA